MVCIDVTVSTLILSKIASDVSGVAQSVTFTPSSQQECFNVSYLVDTIYEMTEGARLTIETRDSGLEVGSPGQTVLEIRDTNG